MTTPINKVLTNQTQTLSNEELANVSASLSAILGQGGGTYTGDGQYIDVDNNTITLTQTAASLLNSVEYKLDTDTYAAASATWEDVANTYKTHSGDYLVESATSAMYYPLTGNPSGFMDEMFIAKYGETIIAELDSAYNAHQMVYCMVPTGTTGTRLAFLAFVNTKNSSEAGYEFQYYRSVKKKSIGEQSDQVIVFTCVSATSNWTSGTRNTNVQIVADDGLSAKISDNGNKLYLGVSADYALKSELPDVTDMATQTWVGQQGYLTSIPNTYALKTDVEAASANALSEAESWVGNQGFLKNTDLTDYATKTYADETSANALGQAEIWVGQQNFATSAGLSADKQFAMTTSGWKEVQGGGGGGETNIIESIRLEGDSADVTITNKKAMIPLATASATGVAGNTGVITKDDKAHLDAAVEYKENPYDSSSPKVLVPQQMFVCESDQQIIDIVTNHTDLINGKGTIFFRITGI